LKSLADTDEIKSRLDVVEIVSERVQLQRAGRNYKANCPFHNEKTPSFIVDPSRQSWRCFGQCASGGDVFSFIMKIDGLEFGDALRMLAQRAGVEVTFKEDTPDRDDFFAINGVALKFYMEALLSDEGISARNYLDQRGLGDNIRQKFGIGYSPKGKSSLKAHLAFHDIDLDKAVECGLLNRTGDGTTRDFFWDRLMFPIHNRTGQVAGFGARSLDDSMPKYINTSATPIFDKSRILYGFHIARDAIRKADEGVIVEGYMDVIAAHEHGYENVVASMGTAVTTEQVRQLRNLAASYVLALDQDEAGQEATLRSLESSWRIFNESTRGKSDPLFSAGPIKLKVLSLPAGKDPDEFIRSGNGEWEKVVASAAHVIDYLIPVVAGRFDVRSPGGKGMVVNALAPLFRSMDPFDMEDYLNKLANELESTPEVVRAALQSAPRPKANARNPKGNDRFRASADGLSPDSKINEATNDTKLDEYALSLIFGKPGLRFIASKISSEYFRRPEDRELFTLWESGGAVLEDEFTNALDPLLKDRYDFISSLELVPATDREAETDLEVCLKRLERRLLHEHRDSLISAQESGHPPSSELQDSLTKLDRKIRETYETVETPTRTT